MNITVFIQNNLNWKVFSITECFIKFIFPFRFEKYNIILQLVLSSTIYWSYFYNSGVKLIHQYLNLMISAIRSPAAPEEEPATGKESYISSFESSLGSRAFLKARCLL
ncbi:hypothetical protein Avbf_19149 [Armadillidium vulgare]|nr:hypothetical protein Avbf_19149 [Armadillidium vulgare]